MITIAITAVGGGVGQAVLRALRYSPLAHRTVGMDVRPMSAGLYWADAACLVPPAADEQAFVERLLEVCSREHLDALIPGSDPEMEPLARHRDLFHQRGCRMIVGGVDAVRLCQDKLALSAFCLRHGLPFAETFSLADARRRINDLRFPVIAKPRVGSGSVGTRLVCEPDELLRVPPSEAVVVQPYLAPGVPDAGGLTGRGRWTGRLDQSDEISAQFFIGASGDVLGSFASVNRLKDGVPVEVVPDPTSPAMTEWFGLIRRLAAGGLRGPVNLQGRLTPEGVRFFEVNPRFTGITGVRAAMGYREVDAALWAFVLEREQEAKRCLLRPAGFVAVRHVEETIVPSGQVACMAAERASAPGEPASLPSCVLVTGASGYVGANLTARLLASPGIREVRAAVRSEQAAARLAGVLGPSPRLSIVVGDLDTAPWPLGGVDAVLHLAAVRPDAGRPVAREEFFLVNVEGTRRLLDAFDRVGTPRLIYLSSQSVYGTVHQPPWSEALPPNPETPYGLSKWISELLCLSRRDRTTGVVILRAARAYGMGHCLRWDELPHKFARLAARGLDLPVHAGGERLLDLVHVRDLCEAILRACSLPMPASPAALNVGGGQMVSVAHLAGLCQVAARNLGLAEPPIEFVSDTAGAGHDLGLDIRRIRSRLGWVPSVGLEDGLCELISASLEQERHRCSRS